MKTGCSFPLHDLHDVRHRLVLSFTCPASSETSLASLGIFFVCFVLATLGLHCEEGNGTPLQYSCLENPINGGTWMAAVHGVDDGGT